jgi:hypothetical protein
VVLDQTGMVQVHEQPRGWMGNGRGCVHVSKRAYGREVEGNGHVRRAGRSGDLGGKKG